MAWGFPFISLFVLTTNILSGLPKKSLKRLAPYKSLCVCVCVHSMTVMSNSYDPMDSSTPDSFVLGIFQARILEWVAISVSRGSSWPKDQTRVSRVSCLGRQILYHCATWEAYNSLYTKFKFSSRIPSLLSKFSNLFKYFKNLPNTSLGLPPKWSCVELWLLVCSYDLFH